MPYDAWGGMGPVRGDRGEEFREAKRAHGEKQRIRKAIAQAERQKPKPKKKPDAMQKVQKDIDRAYRAGKKMHDEFAKIFGKQKKRGRH